jgi:hypothetical protein
MIVKNNTPYLGKLLFTFEKYPHYTGSTILNKVHLDLGFTKLVSRLKPKQGLAGWVVDPKKIELIELFTDGKIGTHTFGPNNEHTLENSFLTLDGQYIGNIKEAWWYFQNGMTVCDEYPHGVAIVWKTALNGSKSLFYGQNGIDGYYGYSHRGGSIFRIGDRIFDQQYEPQPHHYSDDEWFEYDQKRIRTQAEYDKEGWDEKVTFASVMPFNRRGERPIRNWEDAKEAAINLSNYLS